MPSNDAIRCVCYQIIVEWSGNHICEAAGGQLWKWLKTSVKPSIECWSSEPSANKIRSKNGTNNFACHQRADHSLKTGPHWKLPNGEMYFDSNFIPFRICKALTVITTETVKYTRTIAKWKQELTINYHRIPWTKTNKKARKKEFYFRISHHWQVIDKYRFFRVFHATLHHGQSIRIHGLCVCLCVIETSFEAETARNSTPRWRISYSACANFEWFYRHALHDSGIACSRTKRLCCWCCFEFITVHIAMPLLQIADGLPYVTVYEAHRATYAE